MSYIMVHSKGIFTISISYVSFWFLKKVKHRINYMIQHPMKTGLKQIHVHEYSFQHNLQ